MVLLSPLTACNKPRLSSRRHLTNHSNCEFKQLMHLTKQAYFPSPCRKLLNHSRSTPERWGPGTAWNNQKNAAKTRSAESTSSQCVWLSLKSSYQSISCDLRTMRATFFLKPSRSSLHCLAASMFAGDSSFGEDSMEMIEIMILSTWTHKHSIWLEPLFPKK